MYVFSLVLDNLIMYISVIGIGIVATGAPFYLFVVWRPYCLELISYKTALFIQKIFLVYDGETKIEDDDKKENDTSVVDSSKIQTETPATLSGKPSVEASLEKSFKTE